MHALRILSVEFVVSVVDRSLSAGAVADDCRGASAISSVNVSCASSSAARAATTANCEKRSSRLSRFGSKCRAGSKSRTWAAIRCRSVRSGAGDRADAGSRLDEGRPEFVARASGRRNDADPRDDDPVHFGTFAAISFCTSPQHRRRWRTASPDCRSCRRSKAVSLRPP